MYIALDGDFVGRKIETLILAERLDELFMYNQLVSNTILAIEELIKSHDGQIFLCGGDNILAYDEKYTETIDFLSKFNLQSIDLQFSVGYASNVKLSYFALKYAKRYESGKIIHMYINNNEIMIEPH